METAEIDVITKYLNVFIIDDFMNKSNHIVDAFISDFTIIIYASIREN